MTNPEPGPAPTRISRHPERSVDDRETIYAILDEGRLCHVAYVLDGRPVLIPTFYARDADRLLIHGSNSMGLARAVRRQTPLVVAVTHLDAFVVAPNAFNSSANYRSVTVHGLGRLLVARDERRRALDLITDHLLPGRMAEVRPSTEQEIAQTAVVELALDEVSAKTRTGGPTPDPSPGSEGVWSGVVPISVVARAPEPAPEVADGVDIPPSVRQLEKQYPG